MWIFVNGKLKYMFIGVICGMGCCMMEFVVGGREGAQFCTLSCVETVHYNSFACFIMYCQLC